ncbi:hypothetical protein I35_7731 [Burkholderia cenocepacia H111]|nr:hypothetical protein I35_7731 [Burkholderia cenocepacia H111]
MSFARRPLRSSNATSRSRSRFCTRYVGADGTRCTNCGVSKRTGAVDRVQCIECFERQLHDEFRYDKGIRRCRAVEQC